ncbi:MAG: hypothetical protein AAGF31_12555, partial [Planctomycetota bacterium]
FLAVLLCTMGSLVLLLVVMSHFTQQHAIAKAAEEQAAVVSEPEPVVPDPDAELRSQKLEQVQDQIAKLEQKRDEVDEVLRENHLHLSQIEGHIGRLTDKIKTLRAAYAEMKAEDAQHYDDRAQAERNLAQLQKLIDETKQEIDELKDDNAGRRKSFAVVPYKGQNGTERQPIYIECRADHVLLQPEGVRLTPEDFRRPLGVGNPLAAALRASREYLARQNPKIGFDPDAEPYPLIIVRPDGIKRYYDVREAIRSWDSDFGYEMVSGDWDLSFPAPNPALSTAQTIAIEQARMRRALLARAAPRAYGGSGYGGGVAGQRGGGGSGEPYDGRTLGGAGGGTGQAGSGDSESETAYQASGTNGEDEQQLFGGESIGEQIAGGQQAQPGAYSPDEATSRDSGNLDSRPGSEGAESQTGSQPLQGVAATSTTSAPGGQAAAAGQPSYSGSSASAGGEASPNGNGAPVQSAKFAPQNSSGRGTDWAVEKSSSRDIAIRRPVQVVVRRDRLIVLRSSGAAPPSSTSNYTGAAVMLNGPTGASLDEFVARVKERVRSWGIAGQGLYWRPVLKLNVAPDGVDRAQDLSRLLRRSGIDVTFEQTATAPSTGGADATR